MISATGAGDIQNGLKISAGAKNRREEMKKTIIITTIVCLILAGVPAVSHALNIGIGATGWYADWVFQSKNDDPGFPAAPLYGPVLTVGFAKNWSLAEVFLYGKFDPEGDKMGSGKITRFDSDTTINYSITRFMNLFVGFKYMGYTAEGVSHKGYGSGVGLSFTFPMTDNLFFLGNASGLYIRGRHDDPGSEYDYSEPGVNAGASLAYNFTGASTVVSLGARCQRFITKPKDSPGNSEITHTFYGVTLTAVYSFSI
jgi:hypothetical protein